MRSPINTDLSSSTKQMHEKHQEETKSILNKVKQTNCVYADICHTVYDKYGREKVIPKGGIKVKNYFQAPFKNINNDDIVLNAVTSRIGDYIQSFAEFGLSNELLTFCEYELISDFGFNLRQKAMIYSCCNIEQLKHIIDDCCVSEIIAKRTKKLVYLIGAVVKCFFNNYHSREEAYRTVFFWWENTQFCCSSRTCELI